VVKGLASECLRPGLRSQVVGLGSQAGGPGKVMPPAGVSQVITSKV
jgi:hypothetical protein